jgi:hypothetical protein
VKSKDRQPKAPAGSRIVTPDVRDAVKTITREGRIGSVRSATARLENLEKQIDDAHFKNGIIDRSEYKEMSKDINEGWKEIGKSYDAELYNKNAVTGSKVVGDVSIHPDVLGAKNAIGEASKEMKQAMTEAHDAMKDGAQSVYSRMSTTMGKRVGPIDSIQIVRNDHPMLMGESGRLDNISAYDPKTKRIYISSACHTPEQIKAATAFATTQHVYQNAGHQVQDDLNTAYNDRTKSSGWHSDKFGERYPYKKSKSFWSDYQGVVPHGDMDKAGMHMATVSFSTLTSGNDDKVAAILRNPQHRATLFDSMKVFSQTKKGFSANENTL